MEWHGFNRAISRFFGSCTSKDCIEKGLLELGSDR
jgi:hypothetical protein